MGERTSRQPTGSAGDPLSALKADEGPLDSAPRVAAASAPEVSPSAANRPTDWPGDGPIDLELHDRPHASSTTEWWYMNGHVTVQDGRRFSLFAAFFRQVVGRDKAGKNEYAHSVTWALVEPDRRRYLASTGLDPRAPELGLKRIERGLGSADDRVNRALVEILERGSVPKPDRLMRGRVDVAERQLDLDYSGNTFKKLDDGSYRLHLFDERQGFGCKVVFTPKKPPQRHGLDGVVRGSDNELMFYYFIPRCELTGSILCDGYEVPVAKGQGWYDHEFGRRDEAEELPEEETPLDPELRALMQKEQRQHKKKNSVAWDWLSAQLDNGTDVTLYPLTYFTRGESAGSYAVVVDAQGNRKLHHDLTFEPLRYWQSTITFQDYPTHWRCRIPSANIDLEVSASFEDQEFITLISGKPSFWEGRVDITGLCEGHRVRGVGFVERSGFMTFDDLEGFFNAVGRIVRKSIDEMLPLDPTYEQVRELIGSKDRDQYMDGLDPAQLARTLFRPLREIIDRGGKSWRSYAAIACCDLVGGNSRDYVQWLAIPEMMHVGSLIIDDVQDKSTVRRGGPAAHLLYGDAQCINSGTAGYFLGMHFFMKKLSNEQRVRIYDLYMEALRAGHAGQAIDLDGFEWLMPAIVESGNGQDLERRVLAIHRLKTAAPAACMARMGAIAGRGTEAQIEGVGHFFEALGLSFQIVDDVLNLRGFRGDLKSRGEDITHGKVTLPVAKALGRLGRVEREWLWSTLSSKPKDPEVVGRVINLLEECGAIEDCAKLSRSLIEDAWKRLDPLVDDSMPKVMLRAFSWFVLDRHY